MPNPIQKALAQADAIIAQDIALDATLNGTKPIPTFAELAESTLDDLMGFLANTQGDIVIERTSTGDIIVFTDFNMYYIAGTHVSYRPFSLPAQNFDMAALRAGMSR